VSGRVGVRVAVIIPAYNEEIAISKVLADIPGELASEVIVVNNGSSDATAVMARAAGATVIEEPQRGYGSACKRGITYLERRQEKPDIVVFMDGDYADHPEEMPLLVRPIIEEGFDLVIGARSPAKAEKGAMPLQQALGNQLIAALIRHLYGVKCTDLGPFRAIRYDRLLGLQMSDPTYAWPVEMQLKAVRQGLKLGEVPVSYRRRLGRSKISGTFSGTLMAGYKIFTAIVKYL